MKTKFKVGDTVWFISEWDEDNKPVRGKIIKLTPDGLFDTIVQYSNGNTESINFIEHNVSKSRTETLKSCILTSIRDCKRRIKREQGELKIMLEKLKKIS